MMAEMRTRVPYFLLRLAFLLLCVFVLPGKNSLQAQVSAIVVDAGPDVSATCTNPCVNLSGNFVNSFETTSYLVFPTAYTPYSFTTGTRIFVNIDDIWTPVINLPFNFCYFGNNYNQVVIGANGIISFNTTYAGNGCPWNLQGVPNSNPIPNPSLPLNSIMGIYQDIDPTNQGQVYYQLTGTFPNRRLVLSYYQVPYYGDPNSVNTSACPNPLFATMQVVLHETTNVIDMYVQSKPFCTGWNGGRAIQGIQNANGTQAYSVPGRNNQQFSLTNDAVLFVPFGNLATTVRWTQNGNTVSNTGSAVVCPTVPTPYVLEVTYLTCGGTNVVLTDTVIVSPASSFAGNVSLTQALSCTAPSSASATATPTGGAAPYTYLWSNGATTATATGLSAGTYTVTITEGGGCNSIASIVISNPAGVSLIPSSPTNVSCNGGSNGSLTVSASGGQSPYTYLWSNGATTSTISSLSAGNYTVTITDNLGCTDSWIGHVLQPLVMSTSTPVVTNVSCFGGNNGTAGITAGGGTSPYTYLWSSGSITATATNLAAGTYTVTATDSRGCTIQTSSTVGSPPQLLAGLVSTTNVSCNGGTNGSLTVSATGGTGSYQYAWSPSGGSAAVATNLAAGNYTVTVTDQNNCTSTLAGLPVTQPQAIVVTTNVLQNVQCSGGATGSVSLTVNNGTGPYQYLWSTGATTAAISGLIAGNYTATVTDFNGCSTQHTVTINQPSALVISNVNVTNVSCFGFNNGSITLIVNGGTTPYTYTWNPVVSVSASAVSLSAGNYDYQITDNNGCTTAGSSLIQQPAAVNAVVLTQKDVTCYGGSNGSLSVNVGGGTPPYQYAWTPSGGNTATASGLSANNYSVLVTDNAGCTFSLGNLNISEPPVIATQIAPVNVSCWQGSNGSIGLSTQGGTAPYSYLWNTGATTASVINLAAGNYTATITDFSGCTSVVTQLLTSPAQLVISNTTTATSCNGANGTATVSATGGTSPYLYLWDNGATTAQLQNVIAGNYSVTITDLYGCSTGQQVSVSALPIPTVFISARDTICAKEVASLTANVLNAVPSVSYNWSTGATTGPVISVAPLSNQVYTVTITDGNNCTATASHNLTIQPAPIITINGTDQASCLPFGYTFSATVDIPNCNYLWDFGDLKTSTQISPAHNWVTPGVFNISLQATSPVGCTDKSVRNGMITIYPFPEANFVVRPDVLYDYQPIAYFQNTSSGGVYYWWDFDDGSPIVNTYSPQHTYADTGIYVVSLVAESEHGCRDTVYGPVRYLLQSNIYVPLAFTPDNDGKNDEFLAIGTDIATFSIVMKNRWGQTVFESDDLFKAWDGRVGGTDCPDGVYVYIIKYKSVNGKSGEVTGRVTLYR